MEIRSETGETTSILEPLARGEEPEQEGTLLGLRSFAEGGEATAVVGDAPITLAFEGGTLRWEGKIFGSTGCNDYRAAYEHPTVRNTLERIDVARPVAARRACFESPGLPAYLCARGAVLSVLGDLGHYPNVPEKRSWPYAGPSGGLLKTMLASAFSLRR